MKVKRGVNLILGDYRYKKDGKHGGKQHWRYVVTGQGCKGRLHTNIFEEGDEISILHQTGHHHTKFEGGEYTVEEYLGSLRRIVHNY